MSIEKGRTGYIVPEKDTPTIVAQTALDGGHDTALYAQGKLAKENREPVEANPIDPAFPPQFDSWAAGWRLWRLLIMRRQVIGTSWPSLLRRSSLPAIDDVTRRTALPVTRSGPRQPAVPPNPEPEREPEPEPAVTRSSHAGRD